MLSRFSCAGALAALSFGLTLPVSANSKQDARIAITAAYASMDKALAYHDVSTYIGYLHPAFIGVYPQGKEIHGKDKDAASLYQLFALAKTVTSSTKLLSFSLQGGGAVVITREDFAMSGMNEGEPLVIKSIGTLRGFWVKVGGHWLLKGERSLSDTTSMNGEETKTVNGQALPPAP